MIFSPYALLYVLYDVCLYAQKRFFFIRERRRRHIDHKVYFAFHIGTESFLKSHLNWCNLFLLMGVCGVGEMFVLWNLTI